MKGKMQKKKAKKIDSLSKTERLLMEHQGKTMDRTVIELASIAITLVVTGQEDDKDGEEEGKDADEDRFVVQSTTDFYVVAR